MKLFDKTWKLAVSGAVIGLLVMLLAIYGNPANMAICVAALSVIQRARSSCTLRLRCSISVRRSSALSAARSCWRC